MRRSGRRPAGCPSGMRCLFRDGFELPSELWYLVLSVLKFFEFECAENTE